MTTMDCSALDEVAGELALGLLTGADRAEAIAHLERCGGCRREVSTLADAADVVLLLTPGCDPPAGFEGRVMAQLEAESGHRPLDDRRLGRRRPHRRRVSALAGAVAAVVLAVLVLRPGAGDDLVAAAEMRTVGGETVGHAFVHDGDQPFVILDVPAWTALDAVYGAPAGAPYWLEMERRDGTTAHIRIDTARPTPWRVAVEGGDDIVGVAIVDERGRVWCAGRIAD